MKAICVDDEVQVLRHVVSSCQKIRLLDDVRGFSQAQDALEWAAENPVDLALLDIELPGMTGLELADRLRRLKPQCSIIFLTAFSQYALDSFIVHPTGYLLKPFDQARLTQEVEYALTVRAERKPPHIEIRTFGYFEVLVDGNIMSFRRSKSKELLAYLVDRMGSGATRKDAFSVLWEDREYNASMQKQMDVVIRSLRDTLRSYGVDDLFELKNRTLRIRPELVDCDLYRYLKNDEEAISAYFGEYMSQYTWASDREVRLLRLNQDKNMVFEE